MWRWTLTASEEGAGLPSSHCGEVALIAELNEPWRYSRTLERTSSFHADSKLAFVDIKSSFCRACHTYTQHLEIYQAFVVRRPHVPKSVRNLIRGRNRIVTIRCSREWQAGGNYG